MLNPSRLSFVLVPLFVVALAAMMVRHVDAEPAKEADAGKDRPRQVMKNTELMKFLFEPFAHDLKGRAQIEPENRHEWQSLDVATYRLTEAMNLLYFREGKDYMQSAEWRQKVTESRQLALDVGESVKRRDFTNVQVRYELLVRGCNDCHRTFEKDDPTIIQAW